MADYDVKWKAKGWDKRSSYPQSKKVTASSWPEAKSKVKGDVEKTRDRFSKSYSDSDPKPKISYKGSTATLRAVSPKGLVKKETKVSAQSGKIISQKSFGKKFSGRGGGGVFDLTKPIKHAARNYMKPEHLK